MIAVLATRSAASAWLERSGGFLVIALPVRFLIGRAPADVAVSLIGVLFWLMLGPAAALCAPPRTARSRAGT